jgi:hypothetical protein
VLNTVSEVTKPNLKKYEEDEDKWNYEGPYKPQPREILQRLSRDARGEIDFFKPSNPYPGYLTRDGNVPEGYARGGRSSSSSEPPPPASRMLTPDEAWAMTDRTSAIPVNERQAIIDNAGDAMAYSLMSRGDGQGNQFSGSIDAQQGMTPGATQNFNNKVLTLGDDLRWRVTGDAADQPAVDNALPPVTASPPSALPSFPGLPTLPPASAPAAPPAGGVGTAPAPNNALADYMTPARAAPTQGRYLADNLSKFSDMFNTSPGAITASRAYPGGSPSERIRAAALANGSKEQDFGFAKSAANPVNSGVPGADVMGFGYMPSADVQAYIDEIMRTGTISRAKGGEIRMGDGSFVVDARTVSELGNGSSNAGIEILRRLGGTPVRGPGDGVSDSVPARIGGKQEARVARDEVIFSPQAVQKLGGAQKLYALMNKAHTARKKAKRGTDNKLARGLGAL